MKKNISRINFTKIVEKKKFSERLDPGLNRTDLTPWQSVMKGVSFSGVENYSNPNTEKVMTN